MSNHPEWTFAEWWEAKVRSCLRRYHRGVPRSDRARLAAEMAAELEHLVELASRAH